MKKKHHSIIFLLAFVLVVMQSCNTTQKQQGYIVNGNVKGVTNGKAFLAKLDLETNERKNVDSAKIINGAFTFKGKVEAPYFHSIFFNDSKNSIYFFLENSAIDISGDINDLENIKVSGSKEDSLLRSFEFDDIFERKQGMDIMLEYPDYAFSAFTAYYQFQIHNIEVDTMDMIMSNFKAPVKKTAYYKHLNALYKTLKKVAVNQPAPQFTIPDTKGELVSLYTYKGNYVLLDFWASWCAPCRAVNPKLVNIHKRFSNKNFKIIGISVDKNKEAWLNAIKKDSLNWVNVSHLKGWCETSKNYGVKAIPQNFLLDTNGVIIAKNLEPEQLTEKLDSIFK